MVIPSGDHGAGHVEDARGVRPLPHHARRGQAAGGGADGAAHGGGAGAGHAGRGAPGGHVTRRSSARPRTRTWKAFRPADFKSAAFTVSPAEPTSSSRG